jgi:hypothetical protein
MLSLLQWIGLVGATIIIVWSRLFSGLRKLAPTFLGCPMCIGFWVGASAGPWLLGTEHQPIADLFLIGPAVSLLSFGIYLVLERLEGTLGEKR